MHKKEPQNAQYFLGACPLTPLLQSILWAPLFTFALGPLNPLGSPVCNDSFQMGMASHFSRGQQYDHFLLLITKMQVIAMPDIYLYDLSPRRAVDAARFF